jgi:hypothetical protein
MRTVDGLHASAGARAKTPAEELRNPGTRLYFCVTGDVSIPTSKCLNRNDFYKARSCRLMFDLIF